MWDVVGKCLNNTRSVLLLPANSQVRRDSFNRASKVKRRWYSVESNRHLLTGLLDETLAALSCNDHICPNCYKRIRRLPPPARNLLDELTAAADE